MKKVLADMKYRLGNLIRQQGFNKIIGTCCITTN